MKRITLALSAVAFGLVIIASQIPTQKLGLDSLPLKKNPARSDAPDFAAMVDVAAKKDQFFSYLRPKVEQQNAQIAEKREFLLQLQRKLQQKRSLSNADRDELTELATQYKVQLRSIDAAALTLLLARVDVVPVDMVLVQAANESGWGSSRFAIEGNNYFGQWCFSQGCGLVPNARSSGLNHEVARFTDTDASIASYLHNLNTNAAYKELREVRNWLRQADQPVTAADLIPSLTAYSERKNEYVDELLQMLKHNERLL
ncbi:glucosaminidase domain-containing protein [uncultured Ferrimonas sp.]|uniref:glucosaminidase domain-containing protein n=1 Tax=uncultured Ferrimonas sp. TaxID=432640 RepID=UPI00260B5D11|nr:glucosaminidase domain-containing protein [uncultured Ferrimonas sp.]